MQKPDDPRILRIAEAYERMLPASYFKDEGPILPELRRLRMMDPAKYAKLSHWVDQLDVGFCDEACDNARVARVAELFTLSFSICDVVTEPAKPRARKLLRDNPAAFDKLEAMAVALKLECVSATRRKTSRARPNPNGVEL